MSNPSIYLPPMMVEEIKVPNFAMRLKMLNRLNNTHRTETLYPPVSADTVEQLEGIVQKVRCYERNGWSFDGVCSNEEGCLYLSFYRMVPWTEEEIKEAKDWLEKNPQDPVERRKCVTTVYE